MQTVYIEKNIKSHSRVEKIINKLKPRNIVVCDHYKEVFNPKSQNFRIQKQLPALILAEKKGTRIMPSPPGFGIGGEKNFYFSHMLNCLYDCRYCFLQGMYSSANYVVFVNYEDFMQDIKLLTEQAESSYYFFSGYDCDSLAYEPVTDFLKEFIPFFKTTKNAVLELRTKSTNIHELLEQTPFPQCIVAFSFTPAEIAEEIEHKVPSVNKRIQAMREVAERGWLIGLRFDPLIYHPEFKKLYENLFNTIFSSISSQSLHSISMGPLRFPEKMFQKILKLYPHDPLLSHPLYKQGNVFSYKQEIEQDMKKDLQGLIKNYASESKVFECHI